MKVTPKVIAIAAIAWWLYEKHKSGAASAATTPTPVTPGA